MLRVLVRLTRGVALAVALVAVVGFALRQTNVLDRHFIFFPERDLAGDPGQAGLEFEDVFFAASDGVRLHGWFVPGESRTTLVWFHGNAGNIGHRVDNLSLLHRRTDLSIFIFDYRGYGRSEGNISEEGTYLDGQAALDYIRLQKGRDLETEVILFGRSLGAGVAVEMAARNRVRGLILESAFSSVRGMAKRVYPLLPSAVVASFLKTEYDSLSKIRGVEAPVMVLHGDRDRVVPFEQGLELFAAANEPKRFYTIRGAGHNDTYVVGGEEYFDALRDFVRDLTGS